MKGMLPLLHIVGVGRGESEGGANGIPGEGPNWPNAICQ
jgi:hypothetical protein